MPILPIRYRKSDIDMWAFGSEVRKRRGLRIMVISALERAPKNGAEIMDEVESLTRGWWRPSPGSMYPLLEAMAQEGLIAKNEAGKYELTQKAREELGGAGRGGMHHMRPQTVEEMIQEINDYASYFEDLNKSDKARLDPHKAKLKAAAQRLLASSG